MPLTATARTHKYRRFVTLFFILGRSNRDPTYAYTTCRLTNEPVFKFKEATTCDTLLLMLIFMSKYLDKKTRAIGLPSGYPQTGDCL